MKFLCYLGIHFWNTSKEKHKVVDHPSGREYIRVIVRECEHCGKRQYIWRNLKKNFGFRWKTCIFTKDSTINFKEIN